MPEINWTTSWPSWVFDSSNAALSRSIYGRCWTAKARGRTNDNKSYTQSITNKIAHFWRSDAATTRHTQCLYIFDSMFILPSQFILFSPAAVDARNIFVYYFPALQFASLYIPYIRNIWFIMWFNWVSSKHTSTSDIGQIEKVLFYRWNGWLSFHENALSASADCIHNFAGILSASARGYKANSIIGIAIRPLSTDWAVSIRTDMGATHFPSTRQRNASLNSFVVWFKQ